MFPELLLNINPQVKVQLTQLVHEQLGKIIVRDLTDVEYRVLEFQRDALKGFWVIGYPAKTNRLTETKTIFATEIREVRIER